MTWFQQKAMTLNLYYFSSKLNNEKRMLHNQIIFNLLVIKTVKCSLNQYTVSAIFLYFFNNKFVNTVTDATIKKNYVIYFCATKLLFICMR